MAAHSMLLPVVGIRLGVGWWDMQFWAKTQNGEFNGEPPAALAQHAVGESIGSRCVGQFVSASVLFYVEKGFRETHTS